MIQVSKVSKRFGGRTLFDDVSIAFQPGNRYGLTGPNGAGKSTLLKIIMGQIEPDGGHIKLPEKVGILKQNIEDFEDQICRDVVIQGNDRLWQALQERDRLYDEERTDAIGMRLGELEEIVADEDGYVADSDAESLLAGIGISEAEFETPMGQLPTDMQFRVLICQALFGNPEALLLDEPTNHLDLSSITWLEEFLSGFNGTVIVVSHDRYFLNAICTHIADIDYETIIMYPGNYDAMVESKSHVRQRAEADAKSREKKIAQLQEFVSKFSAGTRASQVQSRKREMERLQPSELKESNIQRPYIRFLKTEKTPGAIVLKLKKVSRGYDDLKVIDNFSIEINRGDKIGVIGNNGRGKTTLLKLMAAALEPENGEVIDGHEVSIAYFPQNHSDVLDKETDQNAFDYLKTIKSSAYDQEVRSVMGKMLFGGDDAFKQIKTLSGGETARIILAGMMLVPKNVLILDEPNNHLDLEAVSALAWGLNETPNTVIVASHDRDLIDNVANRIIAFEDDGIHIFEGNLEDYLARKG